jgi:hypothetical protein
MKKPRETKNDFMEDLLDTEQAAKYAGISTAKFAKLRAQGYNFMKGARFGSRLMYTTYDLDKAIPKIQEVIAETQRFQFNKPLKNRRVI